MSQVSGAADNVALLVRQRDSPLLAATVEQALDNARGISRGWHFIASQASAAVVLEKETQGLREHGLGAPGGFGLPEMKEQCREYERALKDSKSGGLLATLKLPRPGESLFGFFLRSMEKESPVAPRPRTLPGEDYTAFDSSLPRLRFHPITPGVIVAAGDTFARVLKVKDIDQPEKLRCARPVRAAAHKVPRAQHSVGNWPPKPEARKLKAGHGPKVGRLLSQHWCRRPWCDLQ